LRLDGIIAGRGNMGFEANSKSSPELSDLSHIDPGGPIGPRSVLFFKKYFSSLAKICLPYVYFGDVRQNFVHQDLPLACLCNVDHLLNHIVSILVFHHDIQRGSGTVRVGGANFFNKDCALGSGGVFTTFFNNIACKLVLREVKHLAANSCDNFSFVFWFSSVE